MSPSTDPGAGEDLPPVPFHRPFVDNQEEDAVVRVLRSGWLTTAVECNEFEQEFAAAVGSDYALAVNSGTAGLHLALEAAGIVAGDHVLTTPYTFTSTAEVVRYLDAEPVFVDIQNNDLNIDVSRIQEALARDPRIRAIVPVHIGGHPCQMDEIMSQAASAGIPVIEDAAHAFPASCGGRKLGTIGTAGVFSFYATKTITTGEGGMIVTDNADMARRMSIMRLHGIDRDIWNRYTSTTPSWVYEIVEAGFKYNLPDLLAAIGRVQLGKSSEMQTMRRSIARLYLDALADRDYLQLPTDSAESSWHLFVIRIRPDRLSITRDEFIHRLAAAGISTSVHYIPLHLMPYYRDRYNFRPDDFPVSLDAYRTAISLPIFPGLPDDSVGRVVEEVLRIGDDALKP